MYTDRAKSLQTVVHAIAKELFTRDEFLQATLSGKMGEQLDVNKVTALICYVQAWRGNYPAITKAARGVLSQLVSDEKAKVRQQQQPQFVDDDLTFYERNSPCFKIWFCHSE